MRRAARQLQAYPAARLPLRRYARVAPAANVQPAPPVDAKSLPKVNGVEGRRSVGSIDQGEPTH